MTWWFWFNWLAPIAIISWLAASLAAVRQKNALAESLMAVGLAVFTIFIIGLWVKLERPPIRTMGETRLWFSFFLAGVGWLTFRHWKYSWLLIFSAIMASLFAAINIFRPEIHSKALMPALQSYYFIPHVTTYMLSYSILAVAAATGLIQLRNRNRGQTDPQLYIFLDNMVYIGLGFLMLGLISGAAWAKEAWGHYWSWDPKETWALITAAAYLLYIHLRVRDVRPTLTLLTLPLGFILLMITWLGVSYLPAASGSVHIYS